MLVERTVAGDQKAFELLVLKYQRRIERLIGRMVRDVGPGRGHRPGNLYPRLPRAAPVPRRGPVLHLAVPDRGQHGQEGAGRPQARPDGLGKRPAGGG